MAQERLLMHKIRDVLRLKAAGLSKRQIAASVGIGPTAVGECLRRAREAGLAWPLADDLDEAVLEVRLYPRTIALAERPLPDWAASRLRNARLRHGQASVEDVNYRAPRKLDKALFQQLATCRWIGEHRNLLVTGPCGVGKSWLSCALAQKACRDG